MGLLDFLGKKSAGGATDDVRVVAEEVKTEIAKSGVDASKIDVKVDDRKVTLSGSAPTAADSQKATSAAANMRGVAQVAENDLVVEQAQADAATYTVQPGDTLWKIAEAHYGHGHGAKYVQIFEANRPMLSDPDSIQPGQRLRIPDAHAPVASTGQTTPKPGDDIVWKAPTT